MVFTFIIRTNPSQSAKWRRVQHFVQATINTGFSIRQLFFQANGVLTAMHVEAKPNWISLATKSSSELVICSQAAEEFCIRPSAPFVIGGLGSLIEAAVVSDKVITFV